MSARTFQPVRAASFYEGDRERFLWRPFATVARQLQPNVFEAGPPTKKEAWHLRDAVIAAAERFNETTKGPEAPAGLLGYYGPKVLKALLSFADFVSGRLDPAQASIADKARVSVRTVIRCLARLKEHGFLDWIHRAEPTGNDVGPQVRQIPNAYGLTLRGRAGGLVRLFLGKLRPPAPCDALAHRDRDREDTEAMLDRTSSEEAARFLAGRGELGDALARLGRAFDRSATDTKPENPDRQG